MSRANVIDVGINEGVYLQRLLRNTEKLARKVGVNPDVLVNLVHECQGKCGICYEGFALPYIFLGPIDEERIGVRAIICGTCNTAVAKCRKELERYAKHGRFRYKSLKTRPRLKRLVILSTPPLAIRET